MPTLHATHKHTHTREWCGVQHIHVCVISYNWHAVDVCKIILRKHFSPVYTLPLLVVATSQVAPATNKNDNITYNNKFRVTSDNTLINTMRTWVVLTSISCNSNNNNKSKNNINIQVEGMKIAGVILYCRLSDISGIQRSIVDTLHVQCCICMTIGGKYLTKSYSNWT